jgi:hypothetical protein
MKKPMSVFVPIQHKDLVVVAMSPENSNEQVKASQVRAEVTLLPTADSSNLILIYFY